MADFSSDEENLSPRPFRQATVVSSSSDSDTPVKVKKKRATRTVAANSLPTFTPASSSIFGGGSKIFTEAKSGKYNTLHLTKDEEEKDISEIFKKKAPPQRRRRKVSKSKTSESESDAPNPKPEVPEVILLEEEETDVSGDDDQQPNTSELSLSQTREPTPPPSPPTPPDDALPVHNKRVKPKVKKALKKLERAQMIHDTEGLDDSVYDPDLAIVDVVSPTEAREKEIMVKVRSRSGVQRIPIKMNGPFTSVFREMAGHEGVDQSRISFYINDQRIKPHDTPILHKITVADIIDCYIKKEAEMNAEDDSLLEDCIELRVQTADAKSRLRVRIGLDDDMEKLMREFCNRQSLEYDLVTFQFDGENLAAHDTPRSLELEDDFCIDVIV